MYDVVYCMYMIKLRNVVDLYSSAFFTLHYSHLADALIQSDVH